MTRKTLTRSDRAQLTTHGLSVEEAEAQLARFRRPRAYATLIRPATIGDGIDVVDASRGPDLLELHERAADAGRFVKFVPASGAASRMFRELLHYERGDGRGSAWAEVEADAANGNDEARTLLRFVTELDRFAFRDPLAAILAKRGLDLASLVAGRRYGPILDGLLEPDGLDYRELPKGLLAFHGSAEGPRTPFEEHLVEAAAYARGSKGRCVLHMTVSPEHRTLFQRRLDDVRKTYESRFGVNYAVDFSVQKPSTDMLAVDRQNDPVRDPEGHLRFRPGGHGSLIENLNDLDGDLIYIKNIDNVQPDRLKDVGLEWKRLLGGLLVQVQRSAFESVQRLSGEKVQDRLVSETLAGIGHRLHVELNGNRSSSAAAKRRFLLDRLNRPIRVCGVVRNTGEPGGGPFWVRTADGAVTLQIVEASQVDPDDEQQQQIFAASTHFNPVDLVCGVRDGRDRPFDLQRFIDPEAGTISLKSSDGRDIKAQERPGLWNGAMAGWNTIFVEVPLQTFSPVKSVIDLLRPEHQ